MGMKKEIYARCEEEGDIVINARLLAEILRKMFLFFKGSSCIIKQKDAKIGAGVNKTGGYGKSCIVSRDEICYNNLL